eukprot:CAMPEP_0198252544 /NCGR_PEP_ID=MMETSP1447-20131203/3038_1 /TAXON_ID=420782 /ORGANISM="Chaetoceros dichaeta, Strain CCMP1751" /LENGTH=287 /DNA_ID=CAMNT_0043937841 /DNA_START=100 /DNA_END=963 /DNA_ORIENTATION=+
MTSRKLQKDMSKQSNIASATHSKRRRRSFKKVIKVVFKRKKQLMLQAQPTVVTKPSSSSASIRSLSMPNEIQVLVDSAMSVYSAVSGASELPEPIGRSIMCSMLPELTMDTESDASIFTQKTPTPACLTPIEENHATPLSIRPPRRDSLKHPYLTKTKYFNDLVKRSFDNMDPKKTGFVDKKDLYSGLLLIHLNLAKFAGIAACKPANCEYVYSVFDDLDGDCLGALDRCQYQNAMAILSSQILQRAAIQWSIMILFVVPVMLQYLRMGLMYVMTILPLFHIVKNVV